MANKLLYASHTWTSLENQGQAAVLSLTKLLLYSCGLSQHGMGAKASKKEMGRGRAIGCQRPLFFHNGGC